jgi:DNA-binding transcriptional ArsR family regulator
MSDETLLNNTFFALANPTRRSILARLAISQATVNELAEPFDMSLPAISKHLKVLEKAGLISRGHEAQFRPCTLNSLPLEALASWTEQYRHIWEARFNRMDAVLQHIKEPKNEQ